VPNDYRRKSRRARDATRSYFDAEVQGLDFNDVSGSLGAINGWVNQKTNGKIPKTLDTIEPADVMFLINALYFYGNWREKFDPSKTTDDVFTTAPGITQPMRLMHRHGEMLYAENSSYQAVDLPCGNSAFTMTVLLPTPGTDIESVSTSLLSDARRPDLPLRDQRAVERHGALYGKGHSHSVRRPASFNGRDRSRVVI
jgi:serpin B